MKVLASLMLLIATLCGCMPVYELKERSIIQALGVDWRDEKYYITLQIFNPKSGGENAMDSSNLGSIIVNASGETISDAIKNAGQKQGKKLFFGNNKLIVLGRTACERDISEMISYFTSNNEFSPKINVVAAEGDAEEIVAMKTKNDVVPADFISKTINSSYKNGLSAKATVFDIVRILNNEGGSVQMPLLKTKKEDEESSSAEITGTAVFRDKKFAGSLDTEETKGYLWLTNGIKSTAMTVKVESLGKISLTVASAKAKIKTEIIDDSPAFFIDLTVKSIVDETAGLGSRGVKQQDIAAIEKAQADLIKQQINGAMQKAIY
ncbi:MAG TPA: hypothetical protein DCP97_03200, partial [Ruminococcaceae bacterium]|nr:hypothetical protein [Oscillospiraceae bacterium]